MTLALKPEDLDFISNFSTLWAVFLGALLATIGGFGATQLEWYLERRRRERNAALFFGEVLATLHILIRFAADSTKIGEPYGPITLRLFRSVLGEVDIYNRNRETLYDLSSAELRARIHTLTLRVSMSIDGIFDATNTINTLEEQLATGAPSAAERERSEKRIANLNVNRTNGYTFLLENADQLRAVVKDLEPIARFSFDRVENAVRRTNT
ncbi:MAG: hypothetical protein ISS15_01375 [Alphaproteobacteria bacterium]|nr:hypothetical protein [Alphaproteobacteria bacterium]MBL7096282.1 hypothetical protein [Alphaproteobacteria bacterium]